MDFPALVTHGLSALSVFSDRISTRLLIMSAIALMATVAGMAAVALIRLTTGYAIPGWASNVFALLTLALVQIGTFIFTFCFVILSTRAQNPFIPVRDYRYFIRRIDEVWPDCGT